MALPLVATAALGACLPLCTAPAAHSQESTGSDSVQGLSIRTDSTNVIFTWPSDPREAFLVLARSNTAPETHWAVLTNHLPASPRTNKTTFLDTGGAARLLPGASRSNLLDLYCVLLIPDFWISPAGATFDGGPGHCGSDFLPIYTGTSEIDPFNRPFVLHVDLVLDSERATEEEAIDLKAAVDDGVERVNLGTPTTPNWVYATGFWLQHDLLTNGPHTLQLRTLLELNTLVGPGEQFLTITNPAVRVWTTNAITYPDWNPQVGGNWRFAAKSADPRVNWRIEIRDSQGRLLMSKTGTTTNGNISWLWDLRDSQGKLHDDLQNDPYFSPSVTTWPLDKTAEAALHPHSPQGQASQTWWAQRLGAEFARKRPPHGAATQPPTNEVPKDQLKPRPLTLSTPRH